VRLVQFLAIALALAACTTAAFVACGPGQGESSESLPFIAADRPIEFPREKAPCLEGMAFVERTYCIDRWEASLVLVTPEGERPFSPYIAMTDSRVRAVSRPAVVPQAYVSREDATIACASAGKRLCKSDEWLLACRGSHARKFPYGNTRKAGVCNDTARTSPVKALFSRLGSKMFSFQPMNDPRLNTLPGTLEKTGNHPNCASEYGVYDMVGNLHEWVDEPTSAFRGGYYLDTHENGDGCDYKTVAHGPEYHDYSTGFRCCADIQN
jgi:formylglycine-generating enzyme